MQQTLLLAFRPQGTPPAGDPPSFEVKAGPGTVTLLEGDDRDVPTSASYETRVTFTGERPSSRRATSRSTAAACG
jgi:hypothetical protein